MCYIRFDNNNSEWPHALLYAISLAIDTTTLKFTQFGIANNKEDLAQLCSTKVQYRRSVVRTQVQKF